MEEKELYIKSLLEGIVKREKTCMKHPISSVIETINGQYILGWNGAPAGIEHKKCLREGYAPGEGFENCPTIHAEQRAIADAAKYGIRIEGAVIYLNKWFPCSACALSIIEAGIKEIVTPDELYQDKYNHLLVPKLQNQPYMFEKAERLIREAKINIIVNPFIRP